MYLTDIPVKLDGHFDSQYERGTKSDLERKQMKVPSFLSLPCSNFDAFSRGSSSFDWEGSQHEIGLYIEIESG